MADLFKNKYRIKSARLENWDYRWNAAYFITICTANRKHYFGDIKNKKMELSPTGAIADILWHDLPQHAPTLQLGNFIVMPNHIHGILILNNPYLPKEEKEEDNIKEKGEERRENEDKIQEVQTLHATSPQQPSPQQPSPQQPSPQQPSPIPKNLQMANISPKPNSISTIIRSYKSATTKHAHRLGFEFEWQTRFYDIIIRDDRAFRNISNYIKNNPMNWKEDKFHL
ncbi:transposase [Salinimicrobium tongyeongense]|uniref:Transposase n=1 Tax=Salinimicrobium tongyeongense TaxID=2809707 RepID=A0ABY6NMC6_9FLAO|nr:transposase [Salinimicrobium tongyeongense]UZH54045.1 transposase [Salinimicrobium tongyeongense]